MDDSDMYPGPDHRCVVLVLLAANVDQVSALFDARYYARHVAENKKALILREPAALATAGNKIIADQYAV